MSTDHIVIAHFKHIDDMSSAVGLVRDRGLDFETFYPFPDHHLEEEIWKGKKRSPVRYFVLLGGVLGCLGAFLMTIWMSVDYPIRVSAKPLISIPAFVVIAFECTVLIGSLFNLLAMFHFCRLPNIFSRADYRPSFSEGTFGLTLRLAKEKAEELKKELEGHGAELVEVQYVR